MANLTIIEGNKNDAVGRRSIAVNGRFIRGYGVPKYKSDADRLRVVEAARGFLGYNEADGSHKKIIDIYNGYKPLARGYAVSYDDAWCATFGSAVAIVCGLTGIIPTECGCEEQIKLFKVRGAWVEDDSYVPKPGDYIFYDWDDSGAGDNTGFTDHVGIVEESPIALNVGGKTDTGSAAPSGAFTAEGIDVSKWQGAVDFAKVKAAGKSFVIIRAGLGLSADPNWEKNYKNAKAAGLNVGAYWAHNEGSGDTVTRALAEADACIGILKGTQLEYPVYYDLEVGDQKNWNAMAYAFCQSVEAAGYYVGLYTSESFLGSFDAAFKQRFTLWVANWSRKPGTGAIWQKSSKGNVSGISGNVDLDTAFKNFPEAIKNAKLNGFGKTAPAPAASAPETASRPSDRIMDLATRTIRGEFGNGAERKTLLGGNYDSVQAEVNHRLTASVDTLAKEVIAGRYGNGPDRKAALDYRYNEVQAKVNDLLK